LIAWCPDAAACLQGARSLRVGSLEGPAEAVGRAKVVATLGYAAPLDLGLALEQEAIAPNFVTEDASEGIRAFGEKRKPKFKGK